MKNALMPLSPAMKSVLMQMTSGTDWTYRPGVGWHVRIFRALGDLGLVVQAPHPGSCKGGYQNHWKRTHEGDIVVATIAAKRVKQFDPIWNGQ
jgi:hypothetical protein